MNELTQAITAGLAILHRMRLTLAGLVMVWQGKGHGTPPFKVLPATFSGDTNHHAATADNL